jgi:hypothetical protein
MMWSLLLGLIVIDVIGFGLLFEQKQNPLIS